MCLLAYKLNHEEVSKVKVADGNLMYKEVLKTGLEFYEWPSWIEKKFRSLWIDQMYNKRFKAVRKACAYYSLKF